MGEFLDSYTRRMRKYGDGVAWVDAGIMSALDPAAFAGPADGEAYDIPYDEWLRFCDAIGSGDSIEVPSKSGRPPVGVVVGGFGGDGSYGVRFGVGSGGVDAVLVTFLEEFEDWDAESESPCSLCDGTGEYADDICYACHGDGVVADTTQEDNGGAVYDGEFRPVGYFEVSSGYLVVSDPCYVLTPDCSHHPESLDAVRAGLGGETVKDMGGLFYCRAVPGRWVASVAEAEGMTGAVLFERG